MTDPAPGPPPPAGPPSDLPDPTPDQHDFEPIYALVTDSSTRTTHHPHVHYIFNDDDPDILLRALAEQSQSASQPLGSSDPAAGNRAIILDLEDGPDGRLNVTSASSLSPSWAVLDTSLTEISPPADDAAAAADAAADARRPNRLMLRVQGVESGGLAPEGDLNLSEGGSRHSAGSAAAGGGQRGLQGKAEAESYGLLADDFDKKMTILRNVVDASEDRRRKTAARLHADADADAEAPSDTTDGPATEVAEGQD